MTYVGTCNIIYCTEVRSLFKNGRDRLYDMIIISSPRRQIGRFLRDVVYSYNIYIYIIYMRVKGSLYTKFNYDANVCGNWTLASYLHFCCCFCKQYTFTVFSIKKTPLIMVVTYVPLFHHIISYANGFFRYLQRPITHKT